MMSRYGIYLPLPIVAALLALIYGAGIGHAWASGILTFALVMLGGYLYGAVGQIIAVVVSALVIFLLFTLPAHRKQAHEEAKRERDFARLPNEEDL